MLNFLQPMFLWFAATALVPLALHLLQRHRTVHQTFPTIRFLKAAQKSSASRLRFENFLLWLLRTLLILALVFAFSLPVIRETRFGDWLGRVPRDVALVIDASYSMSYEVEGGTAWDAARAAAEGVVDTLAPGDRACVFLAGDEVDPIVPEPISDLAAVRQSIRSLDWLPGSSSISDALRMAADSLARSSGGREREIYILTDGQALPWNGFAMKPVDGPDVDEFELAGEAAAKGSGASWDPSILGDQTTCFALFSGALSPENAWVEGVEVDPALLMAGGTAHVTARFGRCGTPRALTAAFMLGGREAARREALPPPGGIGLTANAPIDELDAGTFAASVELPADALPFDDSLLFVLRVRADLPVLVVGESKPARFLVTALRPSGEGPEVSRIEPSALGSTDLHGFDAVYLVDALPLDGQAVLRLEEYVRSGGVVSIWPGDHAGLSAYDGWRILPAAPTEIRDVPNAGSARLLRLLVRGDPLFAGFALPPGVVPSTALKRHLVFGPLEADASVLLDTDKDEPILLSRDVGRGRVFLSALSADRQWSTLPLTAIFLPIIHQMSRFASGLGLPPPAIGYAENVPVDECLPGFQEGDVLIGPDGAPLNVRAGRNEAGDARFVIESISQPGIYGIQSGAAAPQPAFAVNAARAESLLDPIEPVEAARITGIDSLQVSRTAADMLRAASERRRGRPLSETLFWIVLSLAVGEWWLANQTQRRRLSADGSPIKVDPSGRVR